MRDSGAVEHLPLRAGNRTLIADGQRDQHAGVRRLGQVRQETFAHPVAQSLDQVARPPDERVGTRNLAACADRPCRPDAAFEQPGL